MHEIAPCLDHRAADSRCSLNLLCAYFVSGAILTSCLSPYINTDTYTRGRIVLSNRKGNDLLVFQANRQ